jgi:predicted transcriptional regulator
MTKEQVLSSLQELPDSFEPEQLIERIIALQKLEEGLEQIKRGEVVTVEEAKSRLSKWLS